MRILDIPFFCEIIANINSNILEILIGALGILGP